MKYASVVVILLIFCSPNAVWGADGLIAIEKSARREGDDGSAGKHR